MKKPSVISVLFGLLLLNPLFAGEPGLEQLMTRFASLPERHASFIEERHAYYLDSPLKTQGHLTATPPDRLEKNIVSPEPIRQIISGDKIVHSQSGKVVREISLSQQPVLAAAINAMRAVLFGDIHYLKKYFQTHFESSQHHWQLQLIPRQKQIVKYIKSISIAGVDDTVSEMVVTEANGDYSKTRLYEVKK